MCAQGGDREVGLGPGDQEREEQEGQNESYSDGCGIVIDGVEIISICSFALWDAFLLVCLENTQAT